MREMQNGEDKKEYKLPDTLREVIEANFTIDERMIMAYEPVILDLIAGAFIAQAKGIAAQNKLPFVKECRQLETAAKALKSVVFDRLEWPLQQRLSRTVEDAVQALRLSTNLIYDLNAKIKNVNYRHADFLTHTEAARMFLQMATMVEYNWTERVKSRCRVYTSLTFDAYRGEVMSVLQSIHDREIKGVKIDIITNQKVIQNLLDRFIKDMQVEERSKDA